MKIIINAFRRVKNIEIVAGDKLTLLAGNIEQGKSSVLQGISAAISSEPIGNCLKLTEKQLIHLVHTNQPKASCVVETNRGVSGITFPTNKKISEGNPPETSIWASGLINVLDDPEKTRMNTLSTILNALPSKTLLFNEMDNITGDNEIKNKLWDTIDISGWDAAHKHAKEKGSILKGRWEEITGISYGKRIADNWVPDKWDFDLTNANKDDLLINVNEEKEWLDIAIASETIESINSVDIENAKKHNETLKIELADKLNEINKLKEAYRNTKTAIGNLPTASELIIQQCPKCSADLIVINDRIISNDSISDNDYKNNEKEITELNETLSQVDNKIHALKITVEDIKINIKANEKIIDNGIVNKTSSGVKPKASIEDCRMSLSKAGDRLHAFEMKERADSLYKKIKTNQDVIDILSPSGLRLTCLREKLDILNGLLKTISNITEWGDIHINHDTSVTHRGWRYPYLISGSAVWRVRLAVQLAIAQYLKDGLVLIDGADILDSNNKNCLFKLLCSMPFKSIVAMTINKKEDVPDLSKIGGVSYWVEDGKVEKCNF